jgi:hypothetical protein
MMRPLHSRRARTKRADSHQFLIDGVWQGMGLQDFVSEEDRELIADEIVEEIKEVVARYFPRTTNLEFAILKSHLIIENAITQFIRGISFVLVKPEEIRFTFAQKLEIAVLNGFGHADATVLPSVELLNQLRNQIAHRFAYDKKLVDELIKINGADAPSNDRQRISHLRAICAMICGLTAGHIRAAILTTSRDFPGRSRSL